MSIFLPIFGAAQVNHATRERGSLRPHYNHGARHALCPQRGAGCGPDHDHGDGEPLATPARVGAIGGDSRRNSVRRVLLTREGIETVERRVPEISGGDLPRSVVLKLVRRKLNRLNNPPPEVSITLPAFAPQRDSIERFLGSLYAGAALELVAFAGLALRDAVVQHLTALGIARLDSVDLDFVALNDLNPAERFEYVPPGEGKNFGPGFLLAVLVSGHEFY